MDAFAAELEACLATLDAPDDDAGATMIGGRVAPVAAPSGARRSRKRVSRSAIGAIILGVLALAAVIVGLLALRGHGKKHTASTSGATVTLRGVGSYDPFGDNREEHSAAAPRATDHNQTTYWDTEHYTSFTKPGVGLVLDAGQAAKPAGITILTTTPGFTAEIQAGQSAGGPFHPVSAMQTINGTTTIPLDLHAPSRYFVVWITHLPPGVSSVRITEAQAS
jgi:hypothetical protein